MKASKKILAGFAVLALMSAGISMIAIPVARAAQQASGTENCEEGRSMGSDKPQKTGQNTIQQGDPTKQQSASG